MPELLWMLNEFRQPPKRTLSENLTITRKANTQQGFSSKAKEKTVGPEANHMVVENISFFLGLFRKQASFQQSMLNV